MQFKGLRIALSDSVEHPLAIEYAADLTPVVAVKESWASWNARRMAETACVFESEGIRRHGVRADARKDCQTRRRPRGGDQLVFGETATNQYAKRLANS